MQAPKLVKGLRLSDTTALFLFDDEVVCCGDPHTGPWVEILTSGAVRKFEVSDQLVGGYVWTAQRVNRADFPKSPSDSLEEFARSFHIWAMCQEILESGHIVWKADHA